jgi:hypothetical protein
VNCLLTIADNNKALSHTSKWFREPNNFHEAMKHGKKQQHLPQLCDLYHVLMLTYSNRNLNLNPGLVAEQTLSY